MLVRSIPPVSGLVLGLALQVQRLDGGDRLAGLGASSLALRLAASAAAGALALSAAASLVPRALRRWPGVRPTEVEGFARIHAASYLALLAYGAALLTWRLDAAWAALAALAFAVANLAGAPQLVEPRRRRELLSSRVWLAFLFFLSGLAALIYQVTWQRSLFTAFGINIESVTIVVTVFMAGLGLGSLAGGALSRRAPGRLPAVFLACEVSIGLFGLVSLPLIRAAGAAAAAGGTPAVVLAIFALLLPPTALMGATLPVLVEYLHGVLGNVGRTVGLLYFVNTLGSAVACFLTARLLFVLGGQQAAVVFAAGCNLTVGALVWQYMRRVAVPRAAPARGQAPLTLEAVPAARPPEAP